MTKPRMPLMMLAIVTGFWILFSESWTLVYKANLVFHPLVGLVAALLFLARVLPARPSEAERGLVLRAILPALVSTSLFAVLLPSHPTLAGNVAVLCAWPLGLLIVRRGPLPRFLAMFTVHAFTVLTVTGILFAIALGGRALEGVLVLHRAAGFLFVPAWIGWEIVAWRSNRAAALPQPSPWFRRIGLALWVAAAALVVAVGVLDFDDRPEDPVYKFHLSTFRLERRGPDEQDALPAGFSEPDLASRTSSCGDPSSDCHANLVRDLWMSAHGRSMHTTYLQKNVELLASEIGEQNQITCGGCHYNRMMFDRSKTLKDSYTELNYSCTFCHQIDSVHSWDDPRKSDVTVRLQLNHLRMFNDGGQDQVGSLDLKLIRLNPYGHARVFRKPLYFEDQYCQACHRLQIKPTRDTPLVKPKCIDCHMQPRGAIGLTEGDDAPFVKERNHVFPGTNTVAPAVLGQPGMVDMVQRFSRGDLPLELTGWGSFWEPRDKAKSRMLWVLQKAMPKTDPVPGRDFQLRIITINASVDHAFPGGPLDLIEAWQKVTVTDQAGNVLLKVGELGPDHRIDPLAHRMGGYMLGEDDKPIDRDRVWQIKQKVVTRALEFHRVTEDDYSFALPAAATELHIESYWMYRKLNQEFLDWAYPDGSVTTPPIVASELKYTMPVTDPIRSPDRSLLPPP